MKTREEIFESKLFGEILKKFHQLFPDKSNQHQWIWCRISSLTGRSLPEVMMMLVPEAWEKHHFMNEIKIFL